MSEEEQKKSAPSDEEIYRAAKRIYECEGEIEIDSNASVSRGNDSGAYVQAWLWVDYDQIDKKEEVGHLFAAQSRGGKFAMYVDEDGDQYMVTCFVGGMQQYKSTGCTLEQVKEEARRELDEDINYKILCDNIGVGE